jgi:hypothetical protein
MPTPLQSRQGSHQNDIGAQSLRGAVADTHVKRFLAHLLGFAWPGSSLQRRGRVALSGSSEGLLFGWRDCKGLPRGLRIVSAAGMVPDSRIFVNHHDQMRWRFFIQCDVVVVAVVAVFGSFCCLGAANLATLADPGRPQQWTLEGLNTQDTLMIPVDMFPSAENMAKTSSVAEPTAIPPPNSAPYPSVVAALE